ncbi:hypothetical protein FO519_003822 [Halicephalobus sp. NKZ332]|nr:hypothetical protein FO519_003822 [Halicephalobus sp. NKZ332]
MTPPTSIEIPQVDIILSDDDYSKKAKNILPLASSTVCPSNTPNLSGRSTLGRSASVCGERKTLRDSGENPSRKVQRRQLSVGNGDPQSSELTDGHRRRLQRLNMPVIYRLYESQCEEFRGTVYGPDDEDFHPEEASKSLGQALSAGIQCDDKVVIETLLRHNNYQRQKIVAAYEGMYNRVLTDDVEDIAGGFFLDCTLALLQPAHIYSTRLLHYAISSRSFNRPIAVEIALTSTASQLKVIRDAYYSEFRISLERDLNIKVEGLFGQMLKDLLLRNKDPDSSAVDLDYVDGLIDYLLRSENGVDEIGRNLELFERIFVNQSLIQLRSFFDRYDLKSMKSPGSESPKPRDFETAIRKSVNIHSDVRHMMLLFVKISRNVQLYFAEKLHEAILGSRIDHATIIRILVSRSEIDLHDICEEYKRKFSKPIVYDLKNTCSGDFLRLLRRLVDPHQGYTSFDESSN